MPKNKTHGPNKLPETVYVTRDFEDKDDKKKVMDGSWLSATEDAESICEKGESIQVGEYKFVRFVEVVNKTEVRTN